MPRPSPRIARTRGRARTALPLLALGALVLTAAPARSQDFNRSAGFYGGGISFTEFNPGAGTLGLNGSVGRERIVLDGGWIVGVQADNWFNQFRYLGWRLNTAYTRRPLQLPDETRDISVTFADISILGRVLPVRPNNPVQVFVAGGGGFVHYDLGSGERVAFPVANAVYPGRGRTRFAAVVGAGLDILTPLRMVGDQFGFRFEVADHIVFRSPFRRTDNSAYGWVHNRRVVLSAFTGFDFLW